MYLMMEGAQGQHQFATPDDALIPGMSGSGRQREIHQMKGDQQWG